MKSLVLPASLLLVLLPLVGCGAGPRTSARSTALPSAPTADARQTTSTTAAATTTPTTTSSASSSTTTPETHPIAAGFVPLSFTAVSEDDFWLLGSAPCDTGRCTVIARTGDGGTGFTPIAAPELQGRGAPGVTPTLRFADRDDGWAFVTGDGGAFYATHDGGSTWHQLHLGDLVAFASGGGYAYAVTADCTSDGCTDFQFRRARVSGDGWSARAIPFVPDGPVLDLAAHGPNVWLLGTRAGEASGPHDLLARSTDAGQTFSVGDGPCFAGLGGDLEPTSASVLWVLCPTGMMAAAARSTDAGITFAPLQTQPLANSARLAPASDTTALLAPDGARTRPLLTTDGGSSWSQPQTPPGATFWTWAGFTDARVGAALIATHWDAAAQTELQQLWRTTDGGATWHPVETG